MTTAIVAILILIALAVIWALTSASHKKRQKQRLSVLRTAVAEAARKTADEYERREEQRQREAQQRWTRRHV